MIPIIGMCSRHPLQFRTLVDVNLPLSPDFAVRPESDRAPCCPAGDEHIALAHVHRLFKRRPIHGHKIVRDAGLGMVMEIFRARWQPKYPTYRVELHQVVPSGYRKSCVPRCGFRESPACANKGHGRRFAKGIGQGGHSRSLRGADPRLGRKPGRPSVED